MGSLANFLEQPGHTYNFAENIVKQLEHAIKGDEHPNPADVPTAISEEKNKPPVMPTTDDEMVQLAKKRSLTEQLRRRGRASTILTDTLGG